MDIQFLALNGSERSSGTTATCLERARLHLRQRGCRLDVVHLGDHDIQQCSCGRCNSRPDPCPVADDTFAIVERMKAADAVIYASSVHAFGTSSVMQRFMERAGVGHLRFTRPLANKVGGIIVVARRYSDGDVHGQLVNNLLLNGMVLAGSGFPALIRAGGPRDVEADIEGLDAMYRMLDRMIDMCLTLRSAQRALPRPATVEKRTGTLS
ncbi:flavodoxin family protein [Microbispora amethystogenes]|uniref:flavodoxin family protein n=1 Tax=Microbispora amethystogenes TaxID=1427754 RepID=UPI003406D302